ncbi:MAG: hypothetical protein U0941_25800 [Planctomycetaceae bacterium]
MVSLIDYRGLQVVDPPPVGSGGLAIQDDLKTLVGWGPKSVWAQTNDPGSGDGESQDYFPGSLWLRTDTTPSKLFICRSSGTGDVVWLPILLAVQQDSVPKLGGALDVNGYGIGDATAISLSIGGSTIASVRSSLFEVEGSFLLGTSTVPTGATFNCVLGGGATSPTLGAATPDIVSLAAVDKTAGDRRLYIQSALGSSISLGNDRLNFSASTAHIALGNVDSANINSTGWQFPAIGVGVAPSSSQLAQLAGATSGNVNQFGISAQPTFGLDATTQGTGVYSLVSTTAASFTLATMRGLHAATGIAGTGSTVTTMIGVDVSPQSAGSTNNYGVRSQVASSATGAYNIYALGSAPNYFAGAVGIGSTSALGMLESRSTTSAQIVGSYDASNYFTQTVSSAGVVTLNAVGSSSSFVFSDGVRVPKIGVGADPHATALIYAYNASSNVVLVETGGATSQAGLQCKCTNRTFSFSNRQDLDSNGTFCVADETAGAIRMTCDQHGWFGFGGTGLARVHAIENSTTASERGIISEQFLNGTSGGSVIGRKARVSGASRISINTGDILAEYKSQGHDGTAFVDSGKIQFLSSGTIGTGRVPCDLLFFISTDATTSVVTEAARFTNAAKFGLGSTSPLGKLESRSTSDPQFVGSYDASNYCKTTVASNGDSTIATVGTSGKLTLSPASTLALNPTGNLTLNPTTVCKVVPNALANGQELVFDSATELVTVANAATSDTVFNLPANAVIYAVAVRVTVAIPTATSFTVTGATSGTVFSTTTVSTTANSVDPGTAAGAHFNNTAQHVRITPNMTPANSNGRVRVTAFYYTVTPPTS